MIIDVWPLGERFSSKEGNSYSRCLCMPCDRWGWFITTSPGDQGWIPRALSDIYQGVGLAPITLTFPFPLLWAFMSKSCCIFTMNPVIAHRVGMADSIHTPGYLWPGRKHCPHTHTKHTNPGSLVNQNPCAHIPWSEKNHPQFSHEKRMFKSTILLKMLR